MSDDERSRRLAGVDRAVAREMERRRKVLRMYWLLLGGVVAVTLALVWTATRQQEGDVTASGADAALMVSAGEPEEEEFREVAEAFRDYVADRGLEVPSSVPAFVDSSPDEEWHYTHGTLMVVSHPLDPGSDAYAKVCDATGAHLFFHRHPGVRGILTRWLHCEFAKNAVAWEALTGSPPNLEASCDVGSRPPANEFLTILRELDTRHQERDGRGSEKAVTGLVIAAWGDTTEEYPDLAALLVEAARDYRGGELLAELESMVTDLVEEHRSAGTDIPQSLTQLRKKLATAPASH